MTEYGRDPLFIPVQTGIQWTKVDGMYLLENGLAWIPASAGMTVGMGSVFRFRKRPLSVL